jgi:GT2 family glycosyltransferase
VIPTLRGGERLAAALESLEAQTTPARKVVIVDNGARADTRALLQTRFPDVELIVNDVNAGFGRAVNQGARIAVGDALVVTNDDVVLRPDFLERALESFDDADVGMVAGVLVQGEAPARIDAAGLEFDTTLRAWDLGWNRPLAGLRPDAVAVGPCGGAALYRLSAFRDAGGYDETLFAYWEDADLALRLRDAGWRCAVAAGAVAEHHHGGTLGVSSAQRELDAFGRGFLLARHRVVERRPLKALAVALLDWPPLIAHLVLRREAGPIRARRRGVLSGRLRRRSSPPPYELATVGLLEALWRQWRFVPLRVSGRLPAHFGGDRVEATAKSRR